LEYCVSLDIINAGPSTDVVSPQTTAEVEYVSGQVRALRATQRPEDDDDSFSTLRLAASCLLVKCVLAPGASPWCLQGTRTVVVRARDAPTFAGPKI
jgi:hypothetical protein